jgi:transcription elongation factor GreA
MKIGKLENLLSRVKIVELDDMPDNEVYILCSVKVLDVSNNEEITYTLVSPEEADFELDKISVASPVGKSMLGKKTGETVIVDVPDGKIEYKILEITK